MGFVVNRRTIIDSTGNINIVHSIPGGGFIGYSSTSLNQPIHTLTNPTEFGTSANDQFGNSVSISGNYAVIGAWFEDDSGGSASGKAYIFNSTNGVLLHTLNNPNQSGSSLFDFFGSSVSISGNRCIVSSYDQDANSGGSQSGRVYVYNVLTGSLLGSITNPTPVGTSANDSFGQNVSISGNRCIIGAPNEDEPGNILNSGKAYIYDVEARTLLQTFNNPNTSGIKGNNIFGYSVAISGNRCIVGSPGAVNAQGFRSGGAYIFNVETGALIHTLVNPTPSANNQFGYSVAISGNRCIVGANLEDDDSSNSGAAYIFDVNTGARLYTLTNPDPFGTSFGDYFGHSVSIYGNICVVGAMYEDDSGGTDSGKAYIFNVSTGALLHTINNPTPGNLDQFGWSVSISGNYIIIGSLEDDDASGTSAGRAYVFGANGSIDSLSKITQSLYI